MLSFEIWTSFKGVANRQAMKKHTETVQAQNCRTHEDEKKTY